MAQVACNPLVLVPGSQGSPGAGGSAGTNGQNAWTTLTAAFTMPAEGGTDTASVVNSEWLSVGQNVYVQSAGYLTVTAKPTTTSVTLLNPENTASSLYVDNVAPGTIIPIGSTMTAGGVQGPAGAAAGGAAPSTATYIVQTADAGLSAEQALDGLATGLMRNTTGTGVISIAVDGTHYLSPTTGLEPADIGGTVQAWDAALDAFAALVGAADQLPYFTALNVLALTPLTVAARTLLDDATVAAMRTTLGVSGSGPTFKANRNGVVMTAAMGGFGTPQVVQCDVDNVAGGFDPDGGYNIATWRWIPGVIGYFRLKGSIRFTSTFAAESKTIHAYIYKNGVEIAHAMAIDLSAAFICQTILSVECIDFGSVATDFYQFFAMQEGAAAQGCVGTASETFFEGFTVKI